jgi:hypothetical protein
MIKKERLETERRYEEVKERWQTTKRLCDGLDLGVDKDIEMEVCSIGNRIAKEISKRCLEGTEETFDIDVSRQVKTKKAIDAFMNLSFGNIWDVATFGECKGDFNLTYSGKEKRILVQYYD